MNINEPVKRHRFVFNPKDIGGEHLVFTTNFFHNGDPGGIFTNQELTLSSYCNSATIHLAGICITSQNLRDLADQLDKCKQKAIECTRE